MLFSPPRICGDAHVAADEGENRQDRKRHRHDLGRFVDVMFDLGVGATFPVKDAEEEAEHVKGRHARRNGREQPQQRVSLRGAEGLPEDFVFAEEAGKARYPGNGEAGDKEGPVGDGGFLS